MPIKLIPREEYLLWLPKKRMAAGAIIRDFEWKILILKTSYKESWEIPWWVTEKGESLKTCTKREVFEEIWIHITVWDLLCLEYLQTDIDDCLMFIFDGWIIAEKDIAIDCDEIVEYRFVEGEQIDKYITHAGLLKRVNHALHNNNKSVYYEN